MQSKLNSLDGKSIQIDQIVLTSDQGIHLSIKCKTERDQWMIECENVSALHIRELNYPMMIYGFEIRDNLDRGWEKQFRYTIRDFEEGQLEFFCQEINAYLVKIY